MTTTFNQNNYLLQVTIGQKEAYLPHTEFHTTNRVISAEEKEKLDKLVKMFSLDTIIQEN